MRISPITLLLPLAALGLHGLSHALPQSSPPEQATLVEAVQAFRDHRYPAAYGRFAALADAGHAPSASLALLMYRHGPALFGSDWSASPDQQRRWSALTTATERRSMEGAADAVGD